MRYFRGQAPASLLDTYQTERKPHVTEVTRRAVLAGRVITEHNRLLAAMRNHTFRVLTRLPGVIADAPKLMWIPDARYDAGFFAQQAHRAAGWQIPQPWIVDSTGATRRLDDVLGSRWTLLYTGALPTGAQQWTELLWVTLNDRCAVVLVHPSELPGPSVPQVAPFAADFLLDTTRAAYLLVRSGIRRRYPDIKFILSHAGGFVPYASHRMALAITGDTGRSPADSLDDFASFYFDTALSSSAAALPTLLAFAQPGHVTFGSDWPFAPLAAASLFAAGLDNYSGLDDAGREAIDRTNALSLFLRLGTAPRPIVRRPIDRVRHTLSRGVMRVAARLMEG